MKASRNLFTIAILVTAVAVAAQTTHKESTAVFHRSVDDNGKTMHIVIDGTKTGNKPIKFDRTYNVKGFSKVKKDSIQKHIADSLGI